MNRETKEDIMIALAVGVITAITTFFTRKLIRKIQEEI